MKRILICALVFFIVGCAQAPSRSQAAREGETLHFSSAFFAVKLNSKDNFETAVMQDSDGESYELKRKVSASGVLLVDESKNTSIHIKGKSALFQSKYGEMNILEEAK